MTSAMLTDLLKSLALLGGFLLLGVFLRAKIPVFQKTFIPASVIGGFLLLLLGPQCFNVLPVPAEWFSVYSLLPGVLIVPVVAAVPLGLTIGGGKSGEDPNILKNVFPLIGIGFGVSMLQFAVGTSPIWPLPVPMICTMCSALSWPSALWAAMVPPAPWATCSPS